MGFGTQGLVAIGFLLPKDLLSVGLPQHAQPASACLLDQVTHAVS